MAGCSKDKLVNWPLVLLQSGIFRQESKIAAYVKDQVENIKTFQGFVMFDRISMLGVNKKKVRN